MSKRLRRSGTRFWLIVLLGWCITGGLAERITSAYGVATAWQFRDIGPEKESSRHLIHRHSSRRRRPFIPGSFIYGSFNALRTRLYSSTDSAFVWGNSLLMSDLPVGVVNSSSVPRSTITSTSSSSSSILVDAAALYTQQNCPILGTKSIGVDYGLARTGIAVTVGFVPQPLEIVVANETGLVCTHVIRHALREKAQQIIVGLPLHKNGSVAVQTNVTLRFAQELAEVVLTKLGPKVSVILWDERYTSKEAAARMHSRNPHNNHNLYGTVDAEAAGIILEHYYDDNGMGAIPVTIANETLRAQCLATYESRQQDEQHHRESDLMKRYMVLQRRRNATLQARELDREEQHRILSFGERSTRKKRKKKRS